MWTEMASATLVFGSGLSPEVTEPLRSNGAAAAIFLVQAKPPILDRRTF